MSRSNRFVTAVSLVAGLLIPAAGRADDSLAAARDLYAAAAYEDALAVLGRLRADAPDAGRAILQYRAFCLLALGRGPEAERTIEAMVAADPIFRPTDADASPRVRSAFSDVRRRVLPALIQQRYGQAKAAFDNKDFAAAADGFTRVTELLADPDVKGVANQPPLSDLKTLAAGFRDLSVSSAAPPPPPVVAAAAAEPAPAPKPIVPPRPAAPAVPRIYGPEDGNVVPPSVVRQALPAFPARILAALQGALAVVVDEKGSVESARMLTPVNQTYDRLVLEAAKQWKYKPAMLDGEPVKFRRIVQINVSPATR